MFIGGDVLLDIKPFVMNSLVEGWRECQGKLLLNLVLGELHVGNRVWKSCAAGAGHKSKCGAWEPESRHSKPGSRTHVTPACPSSAFY